MADNIDWGAIYDAQVGAQSPPAPSPTGPDWGLFMMRILLNNHPGRMNSLQLK